ncbi:MAG: hypothetical protein Q4G02_04135 [bacterium]|nr:hypothetical protein [bacterium]
MKLKKWLNFFRNSKSENLPLNQRFWLYFFLLTTIILALASGYLAVRLEKLEEAGCKLESIKEN